MINKIKNYFQQIWGKKQHKSMYIKAKVYIFTLII